MIKAIMGVTGIVFLLEGIYFLASSIEAFWGILGIGAADKASLRLIAIVYFFLSFILITMSRIKQKTTNKDEEKIDNDTVDLEPKIIGEKQVYKFKKTSKNKTYVIVEGNCISIDKKTSSNKIHNEADGIKKIHIKDISKIQFKEGDDTSSGYIKVILKESNKNKGGFINLKSNEITIMFKSDYNELAKVLFEEIGIKIDELAESTPVECTVEQIKIQQIKEFKELLDEGIITEEEFDKKKQELLR